MKDFTVTTGDRTLRGLETGGDGLAVIVHHGTPMSRLLYGRWVDDAKSKNLRLIGYDRPGYGGSDRHPGRSVADCVADVVAIADDLGIETFATWGISGGGPHALACAALLPDRVVACSSLASVAPYGAENLDFMAGMGEGNIAEFAASLEGEDTLRPMLEDERQGMAGVSPEDVRTAMSTVLSDLDMASFSGPHADYLTAAMNEGLSAGVDGWLDDDLAFVKDWGFDVTDIKVPVLLWQGREDRMVPFEHGEWLARQIPDVEARLRENEGHLTLIENRVPETHAWLQEKAASA